MNVLKQPSLNTCEQGGISYAKLDPSVKRDQVPVVAARSFIRGATVIFLFNVCLLCFGFLIYNLTGVVIMIVMHGLGDASRNNPRFYYI